MKPIDDLEILREQQHKMAEQVVVYPPSKTVDLSKNALIFSLDIQYSADEAYVAVDVLERENGNYQTFLHKTVAGMAYVPRFFCFREGPPLQTTILKIIDHIGKKPDVLIVDGHGVAHPRKFGVACWLGVQLNIPTIGVAKRGLLPFSEVEGQKRGDFSAILLQDEVVGSVLRTQDATNPVFVSVGHQMDLQTARAIILELSDPYRIAEPIRRADHAARAYEKGEIPKNCIVVD